MPLTPFIGLSLIIHLGIILMYKLFNLYNREGKYKPSLSDKMLRVVGLGIISAVFMVVATNAVILLRASVKDRHSVVHFIENHFIITRHTALAQSILDSKQKNNSSEIGASGKLAVVNCVELFQTEAQAYKYSVVNYLHSQGYPYSFIERQRLASGFNMIEYRGTTQQNYELLFNLFKKNSKGANDCQISLTINSN